MRRRRKNRANRLRYDEIVAPYDDCGGGAARALKRKGKRRRAADVGLE